MEQVIIDGVDIFNPMSKKDLDLIIDSFVQYFGEDKRRVITKRLKNTLYLFTGSEDPYGEICTQDRVGGYINDKIKSLQAEFLGIDIEDGFKPNYVPIKGKKKDIAALNFSTTCSQSSCVSIKSKFFV